jgi:folate-binding protein YgfZ
VQALGPETAESGRFCGDDLQLLEREPLHRRAASLYPICAVVKMTPGPERTNFSSARSCVTCSRRVAPSRGFAASSDSMNVRAPSMMAERDLYTMDTPLLNEHKIAGATLSPFHGVTLPEQFTAFPEEYRAAREAVAIFDTNWHTIVELSGPDRVRYLNAIVSNDVKSLGEGRGTLALLLKPQGHILAELEIYALQDRLLVLSHASVRERTVATLDKFIIMDDVTLSDVTDRFGSLAIEGPRAGTVIAEACGLALEGFSEHAIAEVEIDGVACHLIRHSHFGFPGAEIIAPRERLALLWRNLHASVIAQHGAAIGTRAVNSLRLEAGIPWFPDDFNDSVIPHEAALEATHISFSKGCYTGQEIVERVRSRGQVNRRRVQLKFSVADPPVPLTRLYARDTESQSAGSKGAQPAGGSVEVAERAGAETKEVGIITSSAFSPAADAAIGMAYVRREHNAPGTVLEFTGGTAEVFSTT